MSTLTRKQREMQERESLILAAAREMLLERGYLGLNMDRVADAVEYSKGTVYQHFTCKEDLVAGVALQSMAVRTQLFKRAAAFDGKPRERMTAVGVADEVFRNLHPDHVRIEQVCKIESIWDKTSETRREGLSSEETGCHEVMLEIIHDAVDRGDLVLPTDGLVTPATIMFSLWAMAWGGGSIMASGLAELRLGLTDPGPALQLCFQKLLDGFDWRPLSSQWDFHATIERVQREVFTDEFGNAGIE